MKLPSHHAFPLRLLLAAMLSAAPGVALATASSEASLGAVTITLYDLDLSDAVTPWIDFIGYADQAGSSVYGNASSNSPVFGSQSFAFIGPAYFSALSGSAATALSQSGAAIAGDGSLRGLQSMTASGSAQANSAYAATAWAPYNPYESFSISANTLVSFSVQANVHIQTSGAYDGATGQRDYAVASASLFVEGDGPGGDIGEQRSGTLLSLESFAEPADYSTGAVLLASFVNLDTRDKVGILHLITDVYGASVLPTPVSSVPEPSTYTTLLAGLAMLTWFARPGRARRG
jgi:hypothetical protein